MERHHGQAVVAHPPPSALIAQRPLATAARGAVKDDRRNPRKVS